MFPEAPQPDWRERSGSCVAGVSPRATSRVLVTLTGLWNQLLNLCFPVVAVFLLTISGESTATLCHRSLRRRRGPRRRRDRARARPRSAIGSPSDIGEVAARFANWALGKVRRGPVGWSGGSFERFRESAGDLLDAAVACPHAGLAGGQPQRLRRPGRLAPRTRSHGCRRCRFVDAFAAWALVRLIASVPITPGGIGVVELGLTGALVGFGGNNAGVVAAVLVFRFLTVVPTLVLGLVACGRPGAAGEDSSRERCRSTPVGALTMSELRGIGGDIEAALETVNVPSYVIDPTGVIRWINPAARRLVGDVRGRQFTSVVAPGRHPAGRASTLPARSPARRAVTDAQVVLVDR